MQIPKRITHTCHNYGDESSVLLGAEHRSLNIYVFYWEFTSLPHPTSWGDRPFIYPILHPRPPQCCCQACHERFWSILERSFFHQCHAGWWISPWQKQTLAQLIATYNNTSKLVFGENCIDTSYTKKTCNASRLFQTGHFPKNLEACFHSLLSPSHPTTNPLPFHLSPRAQQPPPIIPPLRIKVASGARG